MYDTLLILFFKYDMTQVANQVTENTGHFHTCTTRMEIKNAIPELMSIYVIQYVNRTIALSKKPLQLLHLSLMRITFDYRHFNKYS